MDYKLQPTQEETYPVVISADVAPYLEADYQLGKKEGETKGEFLQRKATEYIVAVYVQDIQKQITEAGQQKMYTEAQQVQEDLKPLME